MKSGVLKLTALSVVLGIGVLVVLQAQRTLQSGKSVSSSDGSTEGEGDLGRDSDDESSPSAADVADRGDDDIRQVLSESDDGEVVPAADKLSRGTRPQRPRPVAKRQPLIDDEDLESSDAPVAARETSSEDLDDEDRPAARRGRKSLDVEEDDSDAPRSIRLKSRPVDEQSLSDDEADTDEEFTDEPAPRRPTRSAPPSAVRRSGLDEEEDASEESPARVVKSSPPQRPKPTGAARQPMGLSVPDDDEEVPSADEEEADESVSRPAQGQRGKPSRVVPAAAETDESSTLGEDDAGLGADLAEADEGFKARPQPLTDAETAPRVPARTRFADDEEPLLDAREEPAETEATSPADTPRDEPATRRLAADLDEEESGPVRESDRGSRHTVSDDEEAPAERAGDSTSGSLLEEDEPLVVAGRPDEDDSGTDAEISSRSPAKSPSSSATEGDDESFQDGLRGDSRPSARPGKAPPAQAEPDSQEDDPLSIRSRSQPSAGGTATTGERAVSSSAASTGSSGEEVGEPPAPRKARPRLTIDKKAPDTAVIGRPMVYEIVVRNTGLVAARGVTVEDVVPSGVRVDGSKPQAQLDGRRLSWRLGTMEPGSTQTIAVRVTPQSEGTLGGVATVHFESDREGTPRNGPRLQVSVDAPRKVTVGQTVQVSFKVRNVGTTDASSVLIHDVLPAGLRHPQGDDLEYEIGDIPAGGMKEVSLQLTAAQAGPATNRAVITADGAVSEETVVQLEVIGPALNVARSGTKRLNPGKKARFTNTVTNPASTPASNVTLVETVPAGMEFLDATDDGQYDPGRRTVTWILGALDARESKSVSISLNASGRGSQISVVRASDSAGASGEAVGTTQIVGVPALSVEVPDLPGSIDAGQEVPAIVRIYNRGTDSATNTRVTISIPATMELTSIDGPAKYQRSSSGGARGRTEIRFDPVRLIDVKKFAEFKLSLKGRSAGSGKLRVQAACDQAAEPIQREDDITVIAE